MKGALLGRIPSPTLLHVRLLASGAKTGAGKNGSQKQEEKKQQKQEEKKEEEKQQEGNKDETKQKEGGEPQPDLGKLFGNLKSAVTDAFSIFSKTVVPSSDKSVFEDLGKHKEQMQEQARKEGDRKAQTMKVDTTTTGVTIRPKNAWEKARDAFGENEFVQKMFRKKKEIEDSDHPAVETGREWMWQLTNLGNTVFPETETAEALKELRKQTPEFDMEKFLQKMEATYIPRVLDAFLCGKMDVVKSTCRGQALMTLTMVIEERVNDRLTVDPRILDLRNVNFFGAKLFDETPKMILTFQTQQINCVRDKFGTIVAGAEDDIQMVHYATIWQQDESRTDWLLSEMSIQMASPTW